MSTLTWKQVLSPLFPKCVRNLALPLAAQVSHLTLVQYPSSWASVLPLQSTLPLLPEPSFRNLGNAHVLSLLLKTLKSQCLQDKIRTPYLKGTSEVCHLKFLKGCRDLPYILPGALSPLPRHIRLPSTYIPGPPSGPTLMFPLSSHSSFCLQHQPPSLQNLLPVPQGQLRYHPCTDARLSSSCLSLKERAPGLSTEAALTTDQGGGMGRCQDLVSQGVSGLCRRSMRCESACLESRHNLLVSHKGHGKKQTKQKSRGSK